MVVFSTFLLRSSVQCTMTETPTEADGACRPRTMHASPTAKRTMSRAGPDHSRPASPSPNRLSLAPCRHYGSSNEGYSSTAHRYGETTIVESPAQLANGREVELSRKFRECISQVVMTVHCLRNWSPTRIQGWPKESVCWKRLCKGGSAPRRRMETVSETCSSVQEINWSGHA